MGSDTRQRSGQEDAECGKAECGRSGQAVASQGCFKPAVEQNDRQRQGTDEVGCGSAVELDTKQAILSGEQADSEKDQQEWRPEALRHKACQRRQRDERRPDQNGNVE